MNLTKHEDDKTQAELRRQAVEKDDDNDNDGDGDVETFDVKDMKTSDSCIEFIKGFESFQSKMYDDDTGNATIGYGHLVHTGKMNGTDASETDEFKAGITEDRAVELLKEDVVSAGEKPLKDKITVQLAQNQFDALVSCAFNIGGGNFRSSTLVKRVNSGTATADEIKEAFLMWNKGTVKGKLQELKGLTTRRTEEADMYNNNDYER